ncbi:MAG TPA: exodeoxyribonuclease III [Gammaproteobacteria bacterium]|nr:exodeoxyribonuclease III [Gammaproteobacteria bacterium]
MKIASWNVNSLKVRLPHVLDWLAAQQPDVLALQETKLPDENFPAGEINEAGYQVVFSGQRTYNGVAILSRAEPAEIVTDIPDLDDPQRRILAATIDGVRILNLYVVNGSEVGSEKFAYKMDWLDKVTHFIAEDMKNHENYIILGDFNIAPTDEDVFDPEKSRERILCSTPERDALRRILDLGFVDTFRLFEQPPQTFSWWDYRQVAFRRNRGYRIDLILASQAMADRCVSSGVDKEPRKLERPSDHAPVVAVFD